MESKLTTCALCQSMPCCPEHCCDWDSCQCSDCDTCKQNKAQLDQMFTDPEIYIRSTGQEKITKIGKKKLDLKRNELTLDKEMPQENLRANDGALITNFEVEPEEEVLYAGGVKGIRALRLQRGLMENQAQTSIQESQYEESKK